MSNAFTYEVDLCVKCKTEPKGVRKEFCKKFHINGCGKFPEGDRPERIQKKIEDAYRSHALIGGLSVGEAIYEAIKDDLK